jgi:group I intron endonuclease
MGGYMEKISGIYCIENLKNGLKYIGLSRNISQRFIDHKLRLRNNKHENLYFQRSYNNNGLDNFKFWIIQQLELDIKKLNLMEIYWIAYYNSYIGDGGGYNLTRGGDGALDPTEENRKKKSKTSLGNTWNIGRIKTPEEIKKFSDSLKLNGSSRGSKNAMSKLTEEDVVKIKVMLNNKILGKDIAKIVNVTTATISRIKNGKIWNHVFIENIKYKTKKSLNKIQVIEIKSLLKSGMLQKEIAKIYNVTPKCISDINTERNWRW